MKQRLRLAVGIVISLLFLYFSVRKLEWGEAWRLLAAGNYWWLIPATLLLLLINWIRGYRWRLLMYPDTTISLTRIFHFVNIGYLFNNVFPAKAGEVVRAVLAGRMISGGIGQAFSTLLIERLLDVLTVVILLMILIPVLALPAWAVQGGLLFGGVAIVGTIVLLVLAHFGARGVDWLWRLVGRLPLIGHDKVREALVNLLEGFAVLKNGRALPGILISSVLIWVGYAVFNYVIMIALNMQYLPFSAAALVLCTTGMSMIVPSLPGGIGPFELAGVQALALFRVSQSDGFGYTLGLHLYTILAMDVFGVVGLLVEGVRYSDIQQEAAVGRTGEAPPQKAER
jgi:hypothetical protein